MVSFQQVGGGNYIEYQNLRDYCSRHEERHVVYGVTQLVNAQEFVMQLEELGKKISAPA